jgi:23S rRNA (uracil-5-)-methyltransferase RumA
MSSIADTGAKLAANGLDGAPPKATGPLPKRPERGEELELTIERLAHGGEGVARYGDAGYVVFVSGAIPGDRVRAVVSKRKRSYAHARTLEILTPSPERIPPSANHPGVAWQVLPYERQLQIKAEQVEDALRRIGKLDGFAMEEIVPALEQWRYRNKLEYSFGSSSPDPAPRRDSPPSLGSERGSSSNPGAEQGSSSNPSSERGSSPNPSSERGSSPNPSSERGSSPDPPSPRELEQGEAPQGGLVCGFHAPGGWKRVAPIEDCLLASEAGNRARRAALRWAQEQGLRAWDRRRESIAADTLLLRNLVVREGRDSGKLQIRLVTTDGELDASSFAAALAAELGEETLSGVLWTRSSSLAETTMGGETELVWGEAELPERLGELDLRISSEAFFQTNTEMAEVLYGIVADYAALEGWERVYDLYSGIGTIALTLAPRAGELWGIEIVEQAVADAIAAAKRNEVTSAHFFAGDTRLALPELIERAGKPDVVVVDPPRAGLSQKVVRRIVDASPKRVVYVSCNPTTLAPNAAQLVEAGWRLVKVRPVDMFPQTPHIECVALLERS